MQDYFSYRAVGQVDDTFHVCNNVGMEPANTVHEASRCSEAGVREFEARQIYIYTVGGVKNGQPQYKGLVIHSGPFNVKTSRWTFSWRERLRVLFGGSVWLQVMADNQPPVKLLAKQPVLSVRKWEMDRV